MTPLKAIAAAIALQLAGAPALVAQQTGVERLYPAQPSGYVTDVAGVVDPAAKQEMESLVSRLRAVTGAEIAVVTLPTLGDYSEAEVALAILRRWGVGRKAEIGDSTRNAGLVLLLVPRQGNRAGSGALRIEVGYGLEGVVTDATAGRVRDLMLPAARAGDYSAALRTGVGALVAVIARGFGASDSALTATPLYPSNGPAPAIPWWLPFVAMFVIIAIASRVAGAMQPGRRGRIYWGGGPWTGGGWGGGSGWGGGGGWSGGGFGGFGGGGGGGGGGAGGRF